MRKGMAVIKPSAGFKVKQLADSDRGRLSLMLRHLAIRNYKSLKQASLDLGSLAVFLGPNGAGKSNILDALRFVSDALEVNLDYALRERGGINEVRRRSSRRPNNFGLRLDLNLGTVTASYAFEVEAATGQTYRVSREECRIREGLLSEEYFVVVRGNLESSNPKLQAAVSDQDLYLRAVSAEEGFRKVWGALTRMGVYNPNPAALRALQDPDPRVLLRRDGSNLPSVLRHLERNAPKRLARLQEFIERIVPGIRKVEPETLGPKETLVFRQQMDNRNAWRFYAASMADGTLRALAVLGAIFQEGVRVVGIEEPEVALHPGAARVLADALAEASRETQILLTTHSPDLLDHDGFETDAFFAVGISEGVSEVEPLQEAMRTVIKQRLFTPGELLRLGQLEVSGRKSPDAAQLPLFDA